MVNTLKYVVPQHTICGSNIQSTFFEDTSGVVWFTTYEALHFYDPKIDNLKYYFMISPSGDTVRENYKAFYQDETLLFLKAGEGIFVFDLYQRKTVDYYPLNLA